MNRFLLAVVPTVALTSPASADFLSGNDLYSKCTTSIMNDVQCMGYVEGVSDAVALETSIGGDLFGWTACIPAEATASQVRDVVVKYLKSHPELRHLGAPSLVASAIGEAFPCRQRPATRG